MQSAPAVIPAMTQASLPAGFTAPDRTFEIRNRTRASSGTNPVCSASDHTGTSPAHDTRLRSSNRAASADHPCEDLTESAPCSADHRVLDKPDHPSSEGTFPIHTPLIGAVRPRIQALVNKPAPEIPTIGKPTHLTRDRRARTTSTVGPGPGNRSPDHNEHNQRFGLDAGSGIPSTSPEGRRALLSAMILRRL
jgi:hypothetical protein